MVTAKQYVISKKPALEAPGSAEDAALPRKGAPAAQAATGKKVWDYIKKNDLKDKVKR